MTAKKGKGLERKRVYSRISASVSSELKRVSAQRGVPECAIVEAALKTFLSQTEHEAVIAKRLNRLQRQYERIHRDQRVLIETLATFVKVYLAHTPAIPEEKKKEMEKKAGIRFDRFVQILSRTFENSDSFLAQMDEKVLSLSDFEHGDLQ